MKIDKDDFTEEELDGVVFESSLSSEKETSGQNYKKAEPVKKVLKAKNQKSHFGIFYGMTIAMGLIIFITIFAIAFKMFSPTTGKANQNNPAKEEGVLQENTGDEVYEETTPVVEEEGVEVLAVIKMKDKSSKKLNLLDIKENKTYTVEVTGVTDMKSKSGTVMTFDEFKVGDLVDAIFEDRTDELKSLKINKESWEKKGIRGAEIDVLNKEIKLGTNVYKYENTIISVMNDKSYDISEINGMDTINIRGYKDNVLFVELAKGHGKIKIINADKIENGLVEINNDTITVLEKENTFLVQEGSNRVVVRGDNVENILREVEVEHGETVIIDLINEVAEKIGMLTIKANVTDYSVYIDDKVQYETGGIMLDFGTHRIRIEKENYETYEANVEITDINKEIIVELKKVVKTHKITINTDPEGARVYVNNGFVGIAPVSPHLEEGVNQISVEMDGYDGKQLQIMVTESMSYLVKLIPEKIEIEQPIIEE